MVGHPRRDPSLAQARPATRWARPPSGRPVFSVTQALEPDARSAEFRLPYEPLLLDSEYRLSARLDHAEGLLLSEEEERLRLRGEGFHRKLRLTPP